MPRHDFARIPEHDRRLGMDRTQVAPRQALDVDRRKTATAAAPAADAASVVVEGDKVIFYFASGKADPHPDGAGALARIVDGAKAGKKAIVSGYVDSTGSAAANAEIAKQRAEAVRDLLKSLGLTDEQIELQKPADIQGGSGPQARRVEVTLQ